MLVLVSDSDKVTKTVHYKLYAYSGKVYEYEDIYW